MMILTSCGCLLLVLGVPVSLYVAFLHRPSPNYSRLMSLLMDFVMGGARGQAEVNAIHTILLNHFVKGEEYHGLISAVGSFNPGGCPPYRNEAALAEVFRAFLRSRNFSVPDTPDAPTDSAGVWPPPPNFNVMRQSDRNEN